MELKLTNLKTNQLKTNFFYMGILAIIIIVLWIAQSVYTAFTQHIPDKEIDRLLTPLNPTLDIKTLEEFKATRIEPNPEFAIRVVTQNGKQTETYTMNPFTNTTEGIPVASSSSISDN